MGVVKKKGGKKRGNENEVGHSEHSIEQSSAVPVVWSTVRCLCSGMERSAAQCSAAQHSRGRTGQGSATQYYTVCSIAQYRTRYGIAQGSAVDRDY